MWFWWLVVAVLIAIGLAAPLLPERAPDDSQPSRFDPRDY